MLILAQAALAIALTIQSWHVQPAGAHPNLLKETIMATAKIGTILNYTLKPGDLPGDPSVGQTRPAVVVNIFPDEYPAESNIADANGLPMVGDGYNVQVLLDGQVGGSSNDGAASLWKTSVPIAENATQGQLSWPT